MQLYKRRFEDKFKLSKDDITNLRHWYGRKYADRDVNVQKAENVILKLHKEISFPIPPILYRGITIDNKNKHIINNYLFSDYIGGY